MRQVAAAHAASRGVPKSAESVAKSIATRFARQSFIGHGETDIANLLSGLGVRTVQQYPIYRYGVDVAAPELRFAVEILGHYPKLGTVPYRKRVEHILGAGWAILWVDLAVKRNPDRCLMAEHLMALVNEIRRNEPVHGRQWVVCGHCDRPSGIGPKLHKLTGVECPDRRKE
jgi:very-short-patch-repair endonuclease